MRIGVVVVALVLNATTALASDLQSQAISSVVKVRAINANGIVSLGSAVMIARGKLVTNCHVTRNAIEIEVMNRSGTWHALQETRDSYRDMCTLAVSTSAVANIVQLAQHDDIQVGEPVFAVGYPDGGAPNVTRGEIRALHDFQGGKIIQTSAPFAQGESGGALFDVEGRLVGVLTFKARAAGDFHFALPVAWVSATAEGRATQGEGDEPAFWERASSDQPYFLRATALVIDQKWEALSALARDWMAIEPGNPTASRLMKRALRQLEPGVLLASHIREPLAHPARGTNVPQDSRVTRDEAISAPR